MSQQFRAAVVGQLEDLYTAQLEDVTAVPALDEDFQVEYESLYEETYVGGIYLRLFLQNPQYNIRKPEKFVEALLQAHEALAQTEGMAKDLGTICTCVLTVLKVRVMMCDHVANLGYMERLMSTENLSTSHGRKAMLKYMLLLANSATACEKFARNGDGLKTLMGLLENHVNDGKEILDVVKRMMVGSKTAVRTELTAQLEEQGYIEAVMALLKEKNTPMPMKVAGVEVLKEMLQDDDEGTADTVKAKLDTYAEWAEYRDMKHDLFVPQGGEVLLLESGASAETLLLEN
jgi:DnaJ family protein C protein 13